MTGDSDKSVFEFFAGGGLARLGLDAGWRIAFANDFDAMKRDAYVAAFGPDVFRFGDVNELAPCELPGRADLAWASFPCQDLSLAGMRGGLEAARSGAFFGFWRLVSRLAAEGRAPSVIALENVTGLLTSRNGADFAALGALLAEAGYRFGALVIDAKHFLPQSRPRVFVIARRGGPTAGCEAPGPVAPYHSEAVQRAAAALPFAARTAWAWWRLPPPPVRNLSLEHLLDATPMGACWNTPEKTARILALMSPLQRERVEALRPHGQGRVGALFRRIRIENGARVQRVEARFDGLAGCLRTPAGGSSRQALIFIDGQQTRTRLLSPREAARLMGVPDSHPLPRGQTAALKVLGDGVAVPVVRWLSERLLAPLVDQARSASP